METYQILARKYRPQTFEEVVGQKAVVQTLRHGLDSGRIAQAYIFSGMRGVGKTTVARILAKALNCEHGPTSRPCNLCSSCLAIKEDKSVDVLEIDGASNRRVEEINPIRDTARVKPIYSRFKVIIIDEVHMLSDAAFNSLLKTLEEPPPSTVFIFATTAFHKVPLTIVSRCQHFEFKRISPKEIIEHLLFLAEKENISLSKLAAQMIAEAADGSLRDAQSLLDKALAFCGPQVKEESLKEILGLVPKEFLSEVSSIILEGKAEKVFSFVDRLLAGGYDLRKFYEELLRHFRHLLLVKSLDKIDDLVLLTADEIQWLKEEAAKASSIDLLRYLHAIIQAEAGLRYTGQPQVYLETLLFRLCHLPHLVPLKEVIQSLEEGKIRDSLWPTGLLTPQNSGQQEEKPPLKPPNSYVSSGPQANASSSKGEQKKIEPSPEMPLAQTKATEKSFPDAPKKEEIPGEKRLATDSKKSSPEKEAALAHPTVQAFMSFFQARVVSVDPLPRPEEKEEV